MNAWLVAIMATFMGWQVWPNGPLAYYITAALLTCALFLHAAWVRGGRWWAVFGYGAFLSASTAGCGALYAAHADGRHFVCDRGSGLPVSLLSGVLGIAVAVYLLRGKGDG